MWINHSEYESISKHQDEAFKVLSFLVGQSYKIRWECTGSLG